MTPSEIAEWLDGTEVWDEISEEFVPSADYAYAAATIRELEERVNNQSEIIKRQAISGANRAEALKIATEALERFDSAYVIEPNGAIVGLERWHLDGVKQALARMKEVGA